MSLDSTHNIVAKFFSLFGCVKCDDLADSQRVKQSQIVSQKVYQLLVTVPDNENETALFLSYKKGLFIYRKLLFFFLNECLELVKISP
jgi:hypothetical protein